LIIDDEVGITKGLATLLRRDGHTVDTAANGQQALTLLPERHYDLILCDLRMPELDGLAFYGLLLRHYPSLSQRIIFLTGDTLSFESMVFLEHCGQPWIPKPCSAAQVRSAIVEIQKMWDKPR
jgi:DNA-binding response OmpR family regulator